MTYTPVTEGALALASDVQQIIDALTGVAGAGQATLLTQFSSTSTPSLLVRNTGTGGLGLQVQGSSSQGLLDVRDAYTVVDGGSNTLYVDQVNHRVGIGKSNPATALDINGTLTATSLSSTGQFFARDDAGVATSPGYSFLGNTGDGLLHGNSSHIVHIATNSVNAITVNASQQVGIGKNPSATLDVNGAVAVSGGLTVSSGGISVQSTGNLTMGTGQLLGSSTGGVVAPSYAILGDTDSGLGTSGANTIFLATGSSKGLIIDSSQNVLPGGDPGTMNSSSIRPFLYMTGANGPPSGAPTNRTTNSQYPMYYETGSGGVYIHNGSIWTPLTASATSITANAGANTDTNVSANQNVTIESNLDAGSNGDLLIKNGGVTKIKVPYLATAGGVLEMTQAATPGVATSGTTRQYIKSDSHLYTTDSAGTELQVLDSGVGTRSPLIPNGGFEDWASTTSVTVSAANTNFLVARTWNASKSQAGDTVVVSQEATTIDSSEGGRYSLKMVKTGAAGFGIVSYAAPAAFFNELRGRTVTFRVRVQQSVASGAVLDILDNTGSTNSSTSTTTGSFITLTVTRTIPTNALAVQFRILQGVAGTIYIDNAQAVVGAFPYLYQPSNPVPYTRAIQRLLYQDASANGYNPGGPLTAGLYYDVFPDGGGGATNKSFTVTDTDSILHISAGTAGQFTHASGVPQCRLLLFIDSGAIYGQTIGFAFMTSPGVGVMINGVGSVILTGLSAGTHTVGIVIQSNITGTTIYFSPVSYLYSYAWANVVELRP